MFILKLQRKKLANLLIRHMPTSYSLKGEQLIPALMCNFPFGFQSGLLAMSVGCVSSDGLAFTYEVKYQNFR
jgi:hypothetical protein